MTTVDRAPSAGDADRERAAGGGASDLLRQVGLRVRQLRTDRGLTLDALSSRSGVSRRMITMLEAGETNASLGTLDKLSRALDCDFYTMIAGQPLAPLSPEAARQVAPLWEDEMGSTARLLVSHPGASTTELWQWLLAPGARYEAEPDPPGAEEIILVTSGAIAVEVGDRRYPLAAGGYLRLPSDVPYAYANDGDEEAAFIRVIVMP